jgi:hypothetical protein
MSKLQSKDFLNISYIVENSHEFRKGVEDGIKAGRLKGINDAKYEVRSGLVGNYKKITKGGAGLGAIVSGGIGYYLGKKLNNNDAAQSLQDELADNEDTHSLRDKIVNMFKHHHES